MWRSFHPPFLKKNLHWPGSIDTHVLLLQWSSPVLFCNQRSGGEAPGVSALTYPDDPVRTVPPADAVQPFHETNEAVQKLPLLFVGASLATIDITVGFTFHDALGGADAGRQEQETCPPEFERLNQAMWRESGSRGGRDQASVFLHGAATRH